MSDISELEGRISAAMERIGRGLETFQHGAAPDDAADSQLEAVRRELEEEKLATAQMAESVRALTDRQAELEAELVAALEAKTEVEAALAATQQVEAVAIEANSEGALKEMRESMEEVGLRLRRMKQINRNLKQNNAKLRSAVEDNLETPDLVDQALKLNVQSVEVERQADLAVSGVILAGLKPMLVGHDEGLADVENDSATSGEA